MKICSEIDTKYNNGRKKISSLYVRFEDNDVNMSTHKFIKRVKRDIIPVFLQKLNLPSNTRVNWSQFAFCFCGCSPGFLVHDGLARDYDIIVKLDEKDPELARII